MTELTDSQRVLCKIAQCAFDVVGGLLERDQQLAQVLLSNETTSRQIYREECFTSEMAGTLKERFPNQIDITLFTAPEEARNGADWYWRIQKSDGAIHARVQAKRVHRSEFGQSDDNGTVEIDSNQLQRLIDVTASDSERLPGLKAWLATYVRFDATPPCGCVPSECEHHGCRDCGARCGRPSVWIAQAAELKSLSRRTSVRQVIEKSLRLDCLLPCINGSSVDGLKVKGFTLDTSLPSYDECVARIQADAALSAMFEGALQIRV